MTLKEDLLDGLHRRRQYIKKKYKEHDKFIALFEVDTIIKIIEKYSRIDMEEIHLVRKRKKIKDVKSYKRKIQPKGLFS